MPAWGSGVASGGRRLFVGNLAFIVTETDLRVFFGDYDIVALKIINDRDTGESRGFGFVELRTEVAAGDALQQLNGRPLKGRAVRVRLAEERSDRSSPGRGGRR